MAILLNERKHLLNIRLKIDIFTNSVHYSDFDLATIRQFTKHRFAYYPSANFHTDLHVFKGILSEFILVFFTQTGEF